jgi:hypothetical protein
MSDIDELTQLRRDRNDLVQKNEQVFQRMDDLNKENVTLKKLYRNLQNEQDKE